MGKFCNYRGGWVNTGQQTERSPLEEKKDKNTSFKMRSKGPEATQTLVHVVDLGEEWPEIIHILHCK